MGNPVLTESRGELVHTRIVSHLKTGQYIDTKYVKQPEKIECE